MTPDPAAVDKVVAAAYRSGVLAALAILETAHPMWAKYIHKVLLEDT